ncbi:MAG: hypothetical protein LUD50_02215, partial [Clostridia bacterium]|nr:hypothetical protein [Clostridia bacterium]
TFSMSEAVAGFFDYELSAYGLESAEITGTVASFLTDPHSFMEAEIVQILQDTGIEDFLEEAGFGFNALMITLFVVFCAFPAALWAILAIAAFRRLFSKNKKVGMWYVKLCCIWPCILFFILPCVLLAVLPGYLGVEGLFASVSVAIGGSGIVTGICYLLMWVVSIFMCFPTKRKLRRLKAEIKASRR